MAVDPISPRDEVTFEQAEGVEPMPSQLSTKQVSPQARSLFWAILFQHLKASRHYENGEGFVLSNPWMGLIRSYRAFREHAMIDEVSEYYDDNIEYVKDKFRNGDYVKIFGFLQHLIRERSCPSTLAASLNNVMEVSHLAYRVVDRRTIVPIGSEEEVVTISRAFKDLSDSEFQGARAHLRSACEMLTSGDYAESFRESVNSVESVARTLAPSGMLSEALSVLGRSKAIHPALQKGFSSIYGYTSDEAGIRHPLLEESSAKVDETDAIFMLGACAAFVSYMIGKVRASVPA